MERILIVGDEPSKAVLLAVNTLRSEGVEVLIDSIAEIASDDPIEYQLGDPMHLPEIKHSHSRGKGQKPKKDWERRF